MRTKEGRPSSHEVGAQQSTRTTEHTTTTRAFAHGSTRDTFSDLTVWLVWIVLTVVGLLALCALVWIVAEVPS